MIHPSRIEVFAAREQWLSARSAGHRIGASDVASILCVPGSFKSQWELWAEKTGRTPSQADNPTLAQGRRDERRVLEDYAEATGCNAATPDVWAFAQEGVSCHSIGTHVLIRHESEPWAVCSPDGFTFWASDEGWGGVEAKTDQYGHGAWAAETQTIAAGWTGWTAGSWDVFPCPPQYAFQCYWSLAVTGLPYWDIACRLYQGAKGVRPGGIVWHRFMRDESIQGALLERVAAWRERHLVRDEAPPVDESAACSAYVSRYADSGIRRATEAEIELVLEMKQHKAAARLATQAAKRTRNRLAVSMKGATISTPWGRIKPPPIPEERPALPVEDGDPDNLDFEGLHL